MSGRTIYYGGHRFSVHETEDGLSLSSDRYADGFNVDGTDWSDNQFTEVVRLRIESFDQGRETGRKRLQEELRELLAVAS